MPLECITEHLAGAAVNGGNKVVHPSLNLSDGQSVGSGEFGGGGFSFDDFDDCGGLAASGPAFDVF
jgi:hypothetical protein